MATQISAPLQEQRSGLRQRVFGRLIASSYRFVRSALAVVGLVFALGACTHFTSWYARALVRASGWTPTLNESSAIQDATIIVLSASGGPLKGLGADSMQRCLAAVHVWRTGHVRQIVVAGAHVGPAMRNLMVGEGIPQEAIMVEARSTSTRQNALFVRDLLQGNEAQKVLMTSDYHSFRASRAFRRAGIPVQVRLVRDALLDQDAGDRVTALVTELSESVKIVYYFVRGWI